MQVLIDDNPGYALECAEAGIKVLLYDWQTEYPWTKVNRDLLDKHENVVRVHDWIEVEEQLAVLAKAVAMEWN